MSREHLVKALGVLAACAAILGPEVAAADGAVVLMYHRFGDSRYPSTNITIEQFDAHLQELKTGGYHVLPVPEIVAALSEGKPLPDRTIGITIDDAYRSVFTDAWPRFRDAGFPFTLFVATDPVDRSEGGESADYMTWDQVRELHRAGVTIGSQTGSHPHMAAADTAANQEELERSNARFLAELGERPQLFAYPYGEASLATAETVRRDGFAAAFGQHSGAIGRDTDIYMLPRFALNENYGGIDRFKLIVNTLPLPVKDVTPADPLITVNNPPAIGFTVDESVGSLDGLTCYISPNKARIERLGDTRIEVRVDGPFGAGRTRLNCTMFEGNGRWRWYGRQFVVPR